VQFGRLFCALTEPKSLFELANDGKRTLAG
jgi:hypothetical protein